MSEKRTAAFAVIVTCVITAFSFLEVDAQSTVDDSASCGSSTLEEAVNLLREDLEDVRILREELKDVKNLLGSNQNQNNASSLSKKELEDIKTACASNQQQRPQTKLSSSKQVLASSFVCEYIELRSYAFSEAVAPH